ncbi:MAG TPA: PfkB family carbohydrate kinase [Blastocatellia bacterium]
MEFGIAIPHDKAFDAVALGLNAVDHLILAPHYPQFNTKIPFVSHQLAPGGQAATAMVTLARLGLRTRYIGNVGSDNLGLFQLRSLETEGVDSAGVSIVPGAETQTAFIIVDQISGERTILWGRADALTIDPAGVDRELVTSGRILHLDGHDIPASIVAAQYARQAGIPVVIDIDNIYPGLERLLPLVDFLISSATFPTRITGEDDLRNALVKLARTTGSYFVAATLGSEGVLAYHQGRFMHSPAFHVECRDTTGAGDAFHGGFIYGLLTGLSVEETLRMANAVAGLKCTQLGARTGLPTLSAVHELLSR